MSSGALPDQARQLNSFAPTGARVHASGWIHTGPLGGTHLDATVITNLNNRATMNFQTPPPPLGPGAPPPGPPDPNAAGVPRGGISERPSALRTRRVRSANEVHSSN